MTKKQIIKLAERFGRLADDEEIDELTRRRCVDVIEQMINGETDGFVTVKGGYKTGNISLQEFRNLARTDQRMINRKPVETE